MFLQLLKDYPIILGILLGATAFIVVALFGCVFVKWHVRNKADIFFRVLFFLIFIVFLVPVFLFVISVTDAIGIAAIINGAGIDFIVSGVVAFGVPFGAEYLTVATSYTGFWFSCFIASGSSLCFILSCAKGRTSKALASKKAKKDVKQKIDSLEKSKMETTKPQMQYGEFVAFNNVNQTVDDKNDDINFNQNAFAEDGFSGAEPFEQPGFSVGFDRDFFEEGNEISSNDEDISYPKTVTPIVREQEPVAYSVGAEDMTAFSVGNFNLFDGEDITKDLDDAFSEIEINEHNSSKTIFDSLVKLVDSAPVALVDNDEAEETAISYDEEYDTAEIEDRFSQADAELKEDEEPLFNEEEATDGFEVFEDNLEEADSLEEVEDNLEEAADSLEVFEDTEKEELAEPIREVELSENELDKKYPKLKIRTVTLNRPRQMNADIVSEGENPFKSPKKKKEIEISPDVINKKESAKSKGTSKKKGTSVKVDKNVEAEKVVLPLTRKHIILNRTNVVNVFSDYLKEKQRQEKDDVQQGLNTIIMK